MPRSENYDDALEQRYAVLGTRTPACACGENNPFALTGAAPTISCYECQAVTAGRARIEQQHVQGRHNGPDTIAMLGNDHRVADTFKRLDWPETTLRNPDADPLVRAAGYLRGWLDLLDVVIHRTVGWIPLFLENLATWLVARLGPRWWIDITFALGPS